jgi:hypothetical protein
MGLPRAGGSMLKNSERNFLWMAKKLDPKEIVRFRDLLMSNVIEQKALINPLEKEGNHN